MIAWTVWAHVIARPDHRRRRAGHGYPFDFSWTGPWWITSRSLPHVNPWIVLPVALAAAGAGLLGASMLWEPMGRAEAAKTRP